MSLENNINRIADALEGINDTLEGLLAKFNHIGAACDTMKEDVALKKKSTGTQTVPPAPTTVPSAPPVTESVTTPPPAPATPPAPEAAAPTPPPAPEAPSLSKEELNEALVKEFHRLGSRDPIDTVMKKFGVMSLHDLDAKHYATLLKEVQAL